MKSRGIKRGKSLPGLSPPGRTSCPVSPSEAVDSKQFEFRKPDNLSGFLFLEHIMEPIQNMDVFNLGTWLGRKQAFGLMASRCTVGEIECLVEVYDSKMYLAIEPTFEAYCKNHLGISGRTATRLINQYKQQGPNLARLNSFTRIRPSEYRLFAAALTEEGLSFNGETIPLEPENAPKLAQAADAIRHEAAPEPEPLDPAAQAFAKADKSLHAALAEFRRLQAMKLDDEGRLKLVLAAEAGRKELDHICLSTL